MTCRLILAAMLTVVVSGPARAYAQDQFATVAILLEQDRAAYRQLQKQWPSVEEKLRKTNERYRKAARSVASCKGKAWSGIFKETMEGLEKSRVKLEESRQQLEATRENANSALRAQNLQMIILETEYAGKARGAAYWEKYANIVNTITVQYYNETKNKVLVGYEKYEDGILTLSDAYKDAAKECRNPFLGVLKQIAGAILKKVDPINLAADEIIRLVKKV